MKIFPFKCVYPDLSLIKSTDAFFSSVKNKYSEFLHNGFYREDPKEGLYIYEMISPKGRFRGVLAANDLDDVRNLKIKPHEKTLPFKEQHMIELVLERKAMIKPLLVGYDPVEKIDRLVKEISNTSPFISFDLTEDEETHTIWKVVDSDTINLLQRHFSDNVSQAYIADGHHRCSTALLLSENHSLLQNYAEPLRMLTLYLPFGDLKIYDYNRIVKLRENQSKVNFVIRLTKLASIKPLKNKIKPNSKFEFHLYIDEAWYRCKWKKKILEKYKESIPILDISIFNAEIINRILGYEDFELNYFIEYVPGTLSLEEFESKTDKNPDAFGVLLYPVSVLELKSIADQNKTFPPKTTWFEPRIINGIINLELK